MTLAGVAWLLLSGHADRLLGFLWAPLTATKLQISAFQASPAPESDIAEILPVAPSAPEESSEPLFADGVFTTPADIQAMETEYLAAFSSKAAAGTVAERDFRNAAVSATAGRATIRNATATKTPDFEALLAAGADLSVTQTDEPLVLLYHTHTTESYLLADNGVFWSDFPTRSTLADRNMIRVGEVLADTLRAGGIGVIHDKTVYDASYNGAYARSRAGILAILEENPTIQIVLDIHRDAIYYSASSRGKPVAEIAGHKAAQIMIITGAQEGLVTSFPGWESNLRFALEVQDTAAGLYDGLMKPIYFCQRKYNMDVSPCGLLLEFGSDANTLEEAVYSAHLFGKALTKLIEKHTIP